MFGCFYLHYYEMSWSAEAEETLGTDSVVAAVVQLMAGVVSEARRKTERWLVGYIVVTSAGWDLGPGQLGRW